jgi:hypothetical protein
VLLLALVACHRPDVTAIVDPARPEHYFDVPFPSDQLADADGRPILDGYPLAIPELTANVETGWLTRLGMTTTGFANNGAAYFRFDGELSPPATTGGLPTDPIVMVALDGSGELVPLDVGFVHDPHGDPFFGADTLEVAPQLGHAPRSGVTYATVVMESAGARAAEGWDIPAEVADALDVAGVKGRVAVSTSFTVQDATGQLRALVADADAHLPDWSGIVFHEVTHLTYAPGTTESGVEATVCTATYEDGTTGVTYLSYDDGETADVDLTDWPMRVFEATIPTLNYQGEDDRPYMSPGLQHVGDIERYTGWIDVGPDGVASVPWVEPMHIVVQLPRNNPDNAPVVIWDHGTGGHKYDSVQRPRGTDRNRELTQEFADRGWAIIGRDATLYGQRYPLIDEGYGGSLGFYNIVNLPAFRDNQRQTAIDGHVLLRYVQQHLNNDLPVGSVDSTRIRRGGHSLGSVTSNLGLAAEPEAWESAFLVGTGGDFSDYFLYTGLLAGMDEDTIRALFPIFGVEAPDELTTTSVMGAVLGLDEPAWDHVDRLHPMLTLFQWTMDPSDPMSVARDEDVPAFVVIGPGDHQTPDFTAEALAVALPDATVRYCEVTSDYDPHQCLWHEDVGAELIGEWLDGP